MLLNTADIFRPRRMSRSACAALAMGAMLLAACQSPPAPTPSGFRPVRSEEASRLADIAAMDARLGRITFRLMSANTSLCPHQRPLAGWVLHAASQYGSSIRAEAESRFGLTGDLPGVLSVAPDSPAAAAGLSEGDLILAIDGMELSTGLIQSRPSYAGARANLDALQAALDQAGAQGRPARLTIRRGGETLDVALTPITACAYETQLSLDDGRRARADGRWVEVSAGMLRFTASDDDLALIVGHEQAHNILRHHDGGAALPQVEGGLPQGDRATGEADADRLGLILLARAGYDHRTAATLIRRQGQEDWWFRYPSVGGHASSEARSRALEAVSAEISAAQAQGRTPVP